MRITRVDVDVAFNNSQANVAKTQMTDSLNRVLRSIDADIDNLRVEASDNSMVHAKFSLNGNDCASMAFKIEQLVSATQHHERGIERERDE